MGFVVTLIVRFAAPLFLYPRSLNGSDEADGQQSPRSSRPRVGLGTKTKQSNLGGNRRAVTTRREQQEVYQTTPVRQPAVQGELNFNAASIGGHKELWGLRGRKDVTRIVARE